MHESCSQMGLSISFKKQRVEGVSLIVKPFEYRTEKRLNKLINSKISFGLNERYATIPSTDP